MGCSVFSRQTGNDKVIAGTSQCRRGVWPSAEESGNGTLKAGKLSEWMVLDEYPLQVSTMMAFRMCTIIRSASLISKADKSVLV